MKISMKEVIEKIQLKQVESMNSDIYELKECIGEGGQGAVYRTQRKNLLVKLSYMSKDGTENVIKGQYRRYATLRGRWDLSSYLAKPLCELKLVQKGKIIVYGYVMELMEDMVSLQSLFRKNTEKPQEYITRMGGIRRMYIILRKVAEILDSIHSIGYVYGDLNPNNVFVSEDPAYFEVQLIDCDNLMLAADYDCIIHFPGYGAPELINGQCKNNSISDTWSFAVLAFFTLRQVNPFRGKMVMEANTMELSSIESKAEKAELPFIDESEENSSSSALPLDVMEAPKLQQLFVKTFGKGSSSFTRPTLQEWINALKECEYQFVKCANSACGAVYLKYSGISQCPFCDGKSMGPFVVCKKMVRFDQACVPFDARTIVCDMPIKLEIPIAEYKMLQMELYLDPKTKKIHITQFGDDDIAVEWSIKSISTRKKGKIVKLQSHGSTAFSVINGEKNYHQFPEYTFNDGNKARGVIEFACRGLDG